jgi:bifunctional N-acetylglucosamine-1-phosphate-uridyltransferase/glucosamine-1-phosphate-acetyltransferase GlmU-like protein
MQNFCGIVLSFCDSEDCNLPVTTASLLFKSVSLWAYDTLQKVGIKNKCLCGFLKDKAVSEKDGILCFASEDGVNASQALMLSKDFLNENLEKDVLILSGFVPFWSEESLKSAINSYNEGGKPLALTVYQEGENAVGADVGLLISAKELLSLIDKCKTFEDIINGSAKIPVVCKRLRNSAGVKALSDILREKILEKHINNGVYIPCFDGVIIGPDVEIEEGTTILSGTIIKGKTKIGADCVIGPNSFISDSELANNVTFKASFAEQSFLGNGSTVGPFCNLRPNSRLGNGVKVGDFVEIKNSNIGDKTSVAHLTYVGDSDVGSKVNFGCGTVTVNYDGKNKFRTVIGDNVFVGCNSNFIAPVKIEDNAYIAAGSTITEDVPSNSLAIARARQVVKVGWVTKRNG